MTSDRTRIEHSLDIVNSIYGRLIAEREDENPDNVAKGVEFLAAIKEKLKVEYGEPKPEEDTPHKKRESRK